MGTTTILSKHLQAAEITISLVLPKINATIATLQSYRSDEYFSKIFEKMKVLSREINELGYEVKEVSLPRQRKIPKKLDEMANTFNFSNIKDFLRVKSFLVSLDLLIENLKLRFSENDYKLILMIENCLLIHTNKYLEREAEALNKFYKFAEDVSQLYREIEIYRNCIIGQHNNSDTSLSSSSIEDYASLFLKYELKSMLPLVWHLFEVILTCPVSTASAERYFSSLKRLKTYLRNTMGQERLSGLALMTIEKHNTLKLMSQEGLDILTEKFASQKNRRMLFY